MSWISNVVRPKIRNLLAKREVPENLWIKCPETGEMVFHRDLEANHFVVPGSGYHMRMTGRQRFEHFFDDSSWETIPTPDVPLDPLKFRDERRYTDRLKDARAKTSLTDAVMVGAGTARADDPSLTVRGMGVTQQPVRVVDAQFFNVIAKNI